MTYEAPLAGKKLDLAYWYVTHKLWLKKIFIIVSIVLFFLFCIYNIYLLVFNLAIDQPNYEASLVSFVTASPDYQNLRSVSLPQPITVAAITSYLNRDNKFDIVAEIVNSNTQWWASFDYQFQLVGGLTEKRIGFILPGERKKIFDLSVEDGDSVSRVVLGSLRWHKEINFPDLYRDRFKFDVQNIEYVSSAQLGLDPQSTVSRLTFEVTNNTVFNYKSVNFSIFLKSGDQIVAINQASSGQLNNRQTKKIETTFFQRLPKITSLEVVPEINILDQSVFVGY